MSNRLQLFKFQITSCLCIFLRSISDSVTKQFAFAEVLESESSIICTSLNCSVEIMGWFSCLTFQQLLQERSKQSEKKPFVFKSSFLFFRQILIFRLLSILFFLLRLRPLLLPLRWTDLRVLVRRFDLLWAWRH